MAGGKGREGEDGGILVWAVGWRFAHVRRRRQRRVVGGICDCLMGLTIRIIITSIVQRMYPSPQT